MSQTAPPSLLPFKDFFALDVRSLALFRVLMATLLLLDWLDRIPDLGPHFTDGGIMPRELITAPKPPPLLPFSVHLFSGEYWYQALLAGLAVLFALGLLVGYHTPLMGVLSFLLLISAHGRNPTLMQGGDHLLRMMLFWGVFLPLGACWSLDARDPARRPRAAVVRSVASFALVGQIVMVYLFAAVWKWDERWREQGAAVYITLTNESFTTRVGYLLRSQPWLCKLLTQATVYLETLGPVGLFLPFHVGLQRLIVIALFVGFHAGLGLCMELANFPFVGMMIWSALIPPSFWDRLGPSLPVVPRWGPVTGGDGPAGWRPPAGSAVSGFVALCFVYVFFFNVHFYLMAREIVTGEPRMFLPPQFTQLGTVTGLEQGWGLFSPRPTPLAGWHSAVGTFEDGSQRELLRGTSPPDRGRPTLQSTTYPTGRWRKMTQTLGFPEYAYLPPHYARWLLEDWNRRHPDGPKLVKVAIYWAKQPTWGPDEPEPPVEELYLGGYPADDAAGKR